MELRQLICVEAVVRHRHFTRAADELHIAQSALSHQIGRLERELGTPLFERTSRRVTPTEAGEAVAFRARRVMAELEATRQEVDQLRGVLRGHIWVGALLPAGDLDVPGLLARFSQNFPGVEVSLREGIAAEMFDQLAADELDAAFCVLGRKPAADFALEQLSEDEAVIGVAPGRAPSGEYLTVAELAGHRLIGPRRGSALTHAVAEAFAAAGQPFRLSLESGDPFLLRALAAQGFATAILPRSLTALEGPALVVRSLRPAVRLPVALVWRRNRRTSPAAQTFIEFVRSATSLIAAR